MRWMIATLMLVASLSGCLGSDADDDMGGPTNQMDNPATIGDGTEPNWGDPADKTLRPGIYTRHNDAGCTTSFLFHLNWTTYYISTAAHCINDADECKEENAAPVARSTLLLTDESTLEVPVVYVSGVTMVEVGESDSDTCAGNDFALLELTPEALAVAHPASLHFRAPTGLTEAPTDDVWAYGASVNRQGIQESYPKQGRYLETAQSGWSHTVYLATPTIPGDSGGPLMTADGQALGIASHLVAAPEPASSIYSDIGMSLDYMREHVGWAPEIITWDDFNPSLIP